MATSHFSEEQLEGWWTGGLRKRGAVVGGRVGRSMAASQTLAKKLRFYLGNLLLIYWKVLSSIEVIYLRFTKVLSLLWRKEGERRRESQETS